MFLLLAACRINFDAPADAVPDAAPYTATWTAQTSDSTNTLFDVWGSSASDVYVAGNFSILHSAGDGTWTAQAGPNIGLYGVWGTSATDVYACGNLLNGDAAIVHSTGDGTWTQ